MSLLIGSTVPALPLLPLMIFLAEICVVTISTVRIIFISRGMKLPASFLGFFEVSIWLFAIGQIMQNLSNLSCYAAFASGFTLGNFLGILIEQKLAVGNSVVRIITHKDPTDLIAGLKTSDFGVTSIDAQGATGPVQVILTVVKRRELKRVLAIITRFDARVFYSVDDLQQAAEGLCRVEHGPWPSSVGLPLRWVDSLFGKVGRSNRTVGRDAVAGKV